MATPAVVPSTQQQVSQTVTALPEGAQVPAAAPAPVVAPPEPVIDNRPRNADGTFAATETLKSETPEYKVFDIGAGRFRYEYATGEKFTGTLEEIASSNAAAHVKTKQWAQTQRQQVPEPVMQKTPEQIAEEQAQSYILDMVAKSVGLPSGQDLKNTLNRLTESSEQYAGKTLAADFMASTPNFNPTQENSGKLTKILDDAKLPYNLQTLQMAHAFAIQNRVYEPLAATTTTPTVPLIPPMVQGGGQAIPTNNEANINMKADDIKRMLDAARAAQGR